MGAIKMLSEIWSAGYTIKRTPNSEYVLVEDHRPWGAVFPVSRTRADKIVEDCWNAMKFKEDVFDYNNKIPIDVAVKEILPSLWVDGDPEKIWLVRGNHYDAVGVKNGGYKNYTPVEKDSLNKYVVA